LRDNFIGRYRTERNPNAVEGGHASNESATTQNHCGSLQREIQLAPGETMRLTNILGFGPWCAAGRNMHENYPADATVDAEFAQLGEYWNQKQEKLKISTPNEDFNTMINSWTLLQAETCVQWSRFASFVEVGGRNGLGYRDTAQDVMSVIHSNPT